jgi:hypothetical protein
MAQAVLELLRLSDAQWQVYSEQAHRKAHEHRWVDAVNAFLKLVAP